jgi:hypothetical protein
LIMVAPELGEPLLLHIAAIANAVSMVLVVERPEQCQPKQSVAEEACQPQEALPTPKRCDVAITVAEPKLLEANLGSGNQEATGSQLKGALSKFGGKQTLEPEAMEVDGLDPLESVRTIQRPMYYICEVFHDAKTRYLEVHKLLYAVLIAPRKLRHYFHPHKISVVSSCPLRVVLYNSNVTGNIAKWVVELVEFELDFILRHAIKSQVLADFVVDYTPPPCRPEGLDNGELEPRAPVFFGPHWTLFFDDSS